MNTIYDGSFVLGQTSAENPSLLVNENSEGNVSILQGTVATSAGIVGDGTTQNPLRADETVLWEGTPQYTGTLTATESVLNFDHYKVYISERERGTPSVLEFHTENTATSGNNANTNNGGFKAIALTMFQNTNKDFFTINSNHAIWNDSFTELSLSTTGWNKYMSWNSSGFSQWNDANYTPTIRIHKIVGINRKV